MQSVLLFQLHATALPRGQNRRIQQHMAQARAQRAVPGQRMPQSRRRGVFATPAEKARASEIEMALLRATLAGGAMLLRHGTYARCWQAVLCVLRVCGDSAMRVMSAR